jgi:hypothetical protein
LAPILSQNNPFHTIPSYLSKIHVNIVHPPMSWSSQWFLPTGFPTNILYTQCVQVLLGLCSLKIQDVNYFIISLFLFKIVSF